MQLTPSASSINIHLLIKVFIHASVKRHVCVKQASGVTESFFFGGGGQRGGGQTFIWGLTPWLERSLMVRWVVGSIVHGVNPFSFFSFQPVLHDWCNKDRGMCYPVCGMMHIKEPLLLIEKSSLCGGSGFPLSLSEWSFTICLTPYNRR